MEEDNDEQVFRFKSKKEYEDEIKKLISARNSISRKRKKNEDADNDYDIILEEYLAFCTVEENVK